MVHNDAFPVPFSLGREVEDGVIWLRLLGDLDLATAPLLESELARGTGQAIVLDLGELVFIDVAGLRAVLSAETRARTEERELTVLDGSFPVRKLFQLTGNEDLFDGSARRRP